MSLARHCTSRIPYPFSRLGQGLASRGAALAGRVATPPFASQQSSSLHAQAVLPAALKYVRSFSSSQTLLSVDSAAPHAEKHPISALRNISIIAHIDAGKTTLTERLLHLTDALGSSSSSGAVPGDVDSGSTVTDFLEQERQRGITIQSAAVGPVWWPAPMSKTKDREGREVVGITLVDTPGHIDFGIEVERALRVVDGAVVVLDGVEGVESQTENVWSQAARYDVKASILFINKLDRMGSSVAQSLRSVILSGMHARPLLLQLPIAVSGKDEPGLSGLVDLVEMQTLTFSGKAGEIIARKPLDASHEMYQEAKDVRHALVECLASLDEALLEELFEVPTSSNKEPHSKIPASSLRSAIRRQTLAGTILPALCGSAAKNIGIQPLLDAIADFLPSPEDKPDVIGTVSGPDAKASSSDAADSNAGKEVSISLNGKRTTALAFKVVHDKRRGPTTFVRIYSGTLTRTSTLYNTTTGARERLSRVLFPFADQYHETSTLRAGQIGVLLGLRDTRTGDTLVDPTPTPSASASKAVHAQMLDAAQAKTLRLKHVHIPPPVFSMSLEPKSKSDIEPLSEALNLLIRTDPSLHLDESSASSGGGGVAGQMVLSGMGELHLEIAKDRLANEFGVNARMGSVRVSYRETLAEEAGVLQVKEIVERELAGKKVKVGAKMTVRALGEEEMQLAQAREAAAFGGNVVSISLHPPSADEGKTKAVASAEDGKDIEAYLADAPRQAKSKATPNSMNDAVTFGLPPGVDAATVENMFRSGLIAALSRGPLTSNPLTNLHVTVSEIEMFGELSSSAVISYLVSHLMRKLLRVEPKVDPSTGMVVAPAVARTTLMEPMMSTRITLPEVHLGKVIGDITAEQGGLVTDVVHQTSSLSAEGSDAAEDAGDVYIPSAANRFEQQSSAASSGAVETKGVGGGAGVSGKAEIHAVVPLANLVRYSSKLRALTAGNAMFSMQLQGFAKVNTQRQTEILLELGR